MPPSSEELWEEGAIFASFLLVRGNELDEKGLVDTLVTKPAKLPGCSGSRCYQDNLTDLKAQVAANHTGIRLIKHLISEYTMEVVQVSRSIMTSRICADLRQAYMRAIQGSAELAIRNLFKRLANGAEKKTLSAIDYMDDGTPIALEVELNGLDGSARFDFSGTGPEVLGKSFLHGLCSGEGK